MRELRLGWQRISAEVRDGLGLGLIRTAFRSPWQNGYAERWIGSLRRDCLDHVIAINDGQLRRVVRSYVDDYHQGRTHLGPEKDTPEERLVEARGNRKVISVSRVGGLRHRYSRELRTAARATSGELTRHTRGGEPSGVSAALGAERDDQVLRAAEDSAEIRYHAACSLKEHAIKFSEACLREDALAPDPVFRLAAADAALRMPGDRAARC